MMSVCFIPYNKNKTSMSSLLKFRYITPITIRCNVNKDDVFETIKNNLQYNEEINAYGFNKKTNEFWCKKIINFENKLQINISIHVIDYSNSYITITPIVGTNVEISKTITSITKFIKTVE